jgi:hypothetical protein
MLRKKLGYLSFIIMVSIVVAFAGCGGGGGGGSADGGGGGDGGGCEGYADALLNLTILDNVTQAPVDAADVCVTTLDDNKTTCDNTNTEGKITFTITRCFDVSDEIRYWPVYYNLTVSKQPFYTNLEYQSFADALLHYDIPLYLTPL